MLVDQSYLVLELCTKHKLNFENLWLFDYYNKLFKNQIQISFPMEQAAVCNKIYFQNFKNFIIILTSSSLNRSNVLIFLMENVCCKSRKNHMFVYISCNALKVMIHDLFFKCLSYYNWKVLSITLYWEWSFCYIENGRPLKHFYIVCVRPSHWLEFIEFAFIIMSLLMLSLVAGQFL